MMLKNDLHVDSKGKMAFKTPIVPREFKLYHHRRVTNITVAVKLPKSFIFALARLITQFFEF